MGSFYFRLRFHLPRHDSIDCENRELEIPARRDEAPFRLRGLDGEGTIKSARRLVLTGGPYSSSEEAWTSGIRARNALMLYSIRSRVGIDLGKNRSSGGMSNYLRDKLGDERDVQFFDDLHGLSVYDGTKKTMFVCVFPPSLIFGHRLQDLLDLFKQANSMDFQPTPKQEVAFELFGAAQFQSSTHSRFLTLVMAVEALLEPAARQRASQEHVRRLIEETERSGLTESERESLVGSLRWLLQESIGHTGKELASRLLGGNTYAGRSPGSFFRYCYDIRSQLVHNGAIADDTVPLGAVAEELERFVANLLDASIEPVAV